MKMTDLQFAAYLEQLATNLGRLIRDAQNQLNHDGIIHIIEKRLTTEPQFLEMLNWKSVTNSVFEDVETENIEALQRLFDCINDLYNTITMLDPKRNENDKY